MTELEPVFSELIRLESCGTPRTPDCADLGKPVPFLNIRDRRSLDRRHRVGAGGGVRFPSVTGESGFSWV
jgi:hypothetical protein